MGSIRPRPGPGTMPVCSSLASIPVDWITAIYRRAEDVYRAVLTWSLGGPGDEQEVRLHRPTPTFMSGPSRAAKPWQTPPSPRMSPDRLNVSHMLSARPERGTFGLSPIKAGKIRWRSREDEVFK
jgi:hypothetical protein